MLHLRNAPLFFLALLVMLTHLLSGYLVNAFPTGASWVLLAAAILCGLRSLRPAPAGFAASTTILLAIMIICAVWLRLQSYQTLHFGRSVTIIPDHYSGDIVVLSVLKKGTDQLVLDCRKVSLANDLGAEYPDRKLLVRIHSPNGLSCLPGDELTIAGRVDRISGPANPMAWDAAAYYQCLGLRHVLYTAGDAVCLTGRTVPSLLRLPARWQQSLSAVVLAHLSPHSAQLVNALVWGDRSDMDEATRNAFAGAGAMHVLSVSGMHVAMVFGALLFILGDPGRGRPAAKAVRLAVYWSAIGGYVLVTGASAAAVRAGLMIIVHLGGKAVGRETPAWNFLGLAALVQWWIDPGIAGQLGFQLSFLAMAGILAYTTPLVRAWPLQHTIAQWLWSVTAMSLAAQVFILPLLLYHFHQFPLTFILSSFLAIPGGYVIIFGGLVNILLQALQIDAGWKVLDEATTLFIRGMTWLAECNPRMYTAFPKAALVAAIAGIGLFTLRWMYRWRTAAWPAIACAAAGVLVLGYHRTVAWERDEVVIYQTRKGLLMDVFLSGKAFVVCAGETTASAANFAAGPYRAWKDIRDLDTIYCLAASDPGPPGLRLRIGAFRLGVWTGDNLLPDEPVHTLLIVSPGNTCALENLLLTFRPRVVLAASLGAANARRVRNIVNRAGLPLYDIAREGALLHRL